MTLNNHYPLVTICIPTYNGARYLSECLDSVLAQTFQDYEVLIIDDCSSDYTLAIAQEYETKDNRIKIIQNQKNLGLVGNWNRCVEMAQGEWIKFVFQDDFITDDCLEKMLEVGLKGVSFVYCARKFLFESGISESIKSVYENFKIIVSNTFNGIQNITPEIFIKGIINDPFNNIIGEPTCVLLKKSLFYKYGFFNTDLIQICDMEYWNRIGIQVGAAYISQELASFRVHDASTTMQNKKKLRLKFELLIYLHELIFNPQYQVLRDAAKKTHLKINFYKDLKNRSQKIYWQIYRNNQPEVLAEWSDFVNRYPEIKKASKLDLIFLLVKIKNKLVSLYSLNVSQQHPSRNYNPKS